MRELLETIFGLAVVVGLAVLMEYVYKRITGRWPS